jgi:zinc/manganese transport system substrate-binding protein
MLDSRTSRAACVARAAGLLTAALALAGCGSSSASSPPKGHGTIAVVAAENQYGSVASQVGGRYVTVASVESDPNTDPHSYEPSAKDARAMAGARLAIVNGIGYDNWAPKLLAASPVSGRVVLNVGDLLGSKTGGNPHQWYSPASVRRVIAQVVADYDRLDPAGAMYYAQREQAFETVALASYDRLREEIGTRYGGTPVGYSESIFRPLGEDLHLKLRTPYSFAQAVAEGTDVTAQDKQAVDRQARDREIEVWVFNSQNVTPDVQRVNELAKAAGIPIATVTETLDPAGDTFEQWQVAELEGLLKALHEATGR